MNPYVLLLVPALQGLMGISPSIKLAETHPLMVRADKAFTMALQAAEIEYADLPKEERVKKAELHWGWSGPESNWEVGAIGDCVDPSKRTIETCRSVGISQTMDPEKYGFSRKDVVKDGVIGYRVAMRILRASVTTCGSLMSGLGMFASGRCGYALPMVKARCKAMGLTSTCEGKP